LEGALKRKEGGGARPWHLSGGKEGVVLDLGGDEVALSWKINLGRKEATGGQAGFAHAAHAKYGKHIGLGGKHVNSWEQMDAFGKGRHEASGKQGDEYVSEDRLSNVSVGGKGERPVRRSSPTT